MTPQSSMFCYPGARTTWFREKFPSFLHVKPGVQSKGSHIIVNSADCIQIWEAAMFIFLVASSKSITVLTVAKVWKHSLNDMQCLTKIALESERLKQNWLSWINFIRQEFFYSIKQMKNDSLLIMLLKLQVSSLPLFLGRTVSNNFINEYINIEFNFVILPYITVFHVTLITNYQVKRTKHCVIRQYTH